MYNRLLKLFILKIYRRYFLWTTFLLFRCHETVRFIWKTENSSIPPHQRHRSYHPRHKKELNIPHLSPCIQSIYL